MARDRNIDLNESATLPSCDEGITGGTNGAAAPVRALRRGFQKMGQGAIDPPGEREDDDGSTYEGPPYVEGGFLNRPQGEER